MWSVSIGLKGDEAFDLCDRGKVWRGVKECGSKGFQVVDGVSKGREWIIEAELTESIDQS